MSRDHTAKDERERERVTAAGGKAFEVKYRGEGIDGKGACGARGGGM